MRLKILYAGEVNNEFNSKLNHDTTAFAMKRGSKFQGWGVCGTSASHYRVPAIYTEDGSIITLEPSSSNIGIRAVTEYENIKDICNNVNIIDDRFIEVEYGEYPQELVEYENQTQLDYDLLNGKLMDTGKTYVANVGTYSQTTNLKEVIDKDGNKYVNKLNTWYKVNPVKWVVDLHTNTAVSKNIISGGISWGDLSPTRYHYEYLLASQQNIFGLLKRIGEELEPSSVTYNLEESIIGRNIWELHDPMPKENRKDVYCTPKVKTLGTK